MKWSKLILYHMVYYTVGRRLIINMPKPQDQNASTSSSGSTVRLCEEIVHKMEKALKRGNVLNKRQCQDLTTNLSFLIAFIREHEEWLIINNAVVAGHLAALYRNYEKAGELVNQCAEEEWCAAAVFQDGNWSSFSHILYLIKSLTIEILEYLKNDLVGNFDCTEILNFVAEPVLFTGYEKRRYEDKNELRKRLEGLASERSTRICGFFLPDRAASKRQHLARYLLKKQKFQFDYKRSSFTSEALETILWEKDTEPKDTWGVPKFLGAGSGASGVLKTSWLGVPCAKKEFHGWASHAIFMKEAWIMARLEKHPCIVDFICCGNGEGKGDRFIAMELMEKNLFDLIEDRKGLHFSRDVALDIILQIADGVKFLHDNGIAHRDLKPQNVVVKTLRSPYHEDYYCVKLVDFGISKSEVEASKSNTMTFRGAGTTRYRAPEVYPNPDFEGRGLEGWFGPVKWYNMGLKASGKVDWFKADAYSFAMTCAHVLTLEQPFESMETLNNLYSNLLDGQRPILPSVCSKELVQLVEECWSTNRHKRPKFYDICLRWKVIVSNTFQVSTFDRMHGKGYPKAEVCASTETRIFCNPEVVSGPNKIDASLTSNLIVDQPILPVEEPIPLVTKSSNSIYCSVATTPVEEPISLVKKSPSSRYCTAPTTPSTTSPPLDLLTNSACHKIS